MRNWMTGCVGLVAAGVIAGCGASLAESDPKGYEACSAFSESIQAVDGTTKIGLLMEAGELAAKSSTEAIRDTTDLLFDAEAMESLGDGARNFALPDADALEKACEDAGFDLPARD